MMNDDAYMHKELNIQQPAHYLCVFEKFHQISTLLTLFKVLNFW